MKYAIIGAIVMNTVYFCTGSDINNVPMVMKIPIDYNNPKALKKFAQQLSGNDKLQVQVSFNVYPSLAAGYNLDIPDDIMGNIIRLCAQSVLPLVFVNKSSYGNARFSIICTKDLFEFNLSVMEDYKSREISAHSSMINDPTQRTNLRKKNINRLASHEITIFCALAAHITFTCKYFEVKTKNESSKGMRLLLGILGKNVFFKNNNIRITFSNVHDDVRYLSAALKANRILTTLNLRNNNIDSEGVRYVSDALTINKTLTTLNLWHNKIGNEGIKYLSAALKVNKILTTLNLGYNQIESEGAQYISDALEKSANDRIKVIF
jgi:Leucine Rich repeat